MRLRKVVATVSVVPGQLAIAAFSSRLNKSGNSVRAQQAISQIAGDVGVDLYGPNPDGPVFGNRGTKKGA